MTEALSRLFSPVTLAGHTIPNRIVMAPLTRQMAEEDGTPTAEMAGYYARRARGGFGLIITEGTYETDDRHGCKAYLSQPGIANAKHVAGWKKVVEAIHAHGSKAILQLMHGGRVSDPRALPKGVQPGSASAGQSAGWVLYTDNDDEKHLRGITGPRQMQNDINRYHHELRTLLSKRERAIAHQHRGRRTKEFPSANRHHPFHSEKSHRTNPNNYPSSCCAAFSN